MYIFVASQDRIPIWSSFLRKIAVLDLRRRGDADSGDVLGYCTPVAFLLDLVKHEDKKRTFCKVQTSDRMMPVVKQQYSYLVCLKGRCRYH